MGAIQDIFSRPYQEAKQQENLHRQQVLMQAWEAFLPNSPSKGYAEFETAWLAARLKALEDEGLVTLADSL